MNRDCYDVVILGAGLAGAATAWFLGREDEGPSAGRVLVLDQEAQLGVHSSGRNAHLVCATAADPEVAALAREGAAFLRAPPADLAGAPRMRRTGSVFLGRREVLERRSAAGSGWWDPDQLRRALPGFQAQADAWGLHTPEDGVVDPRTLVRAFLDGAARRGAEVCLGEGVRALARCEDGVRVRTASREVTAAQLVVATGAFTGPLVRPLGLEPGLRPTRRHVLVTGPLPGLDPAQPWLWDLDRGFYTRPCEGGLLLCACDEDAAPEGDCPRQDEQVEVIRRAAAQCLPGLPDWSVSRFWAGVRTFRPDRRMRLEREPQLPALVWAVGLGGHGLTAAPAVGRRVAACVREGTGRHSRASA